MKTRIFVLSFRFILIFGEIFRFRKSFQRYSISELWNGNFAIFSIEVILLIFVCHPIVSQLAFSAYHWCILSRNTDVASIVHMVVKSLATFFFPCEEKRKRAARVCYIYLSIVAILNLQSYLFLFEVKLPDFKTSEYAFIPI